MSYQLTQHVFFIGFMGAGKTSVARLLSQQLAVPFVDMDETIEKDTGRCIADIFAQEGEEAFRSLESALLTSLADAPPALISCGGGIVDRLENRTIMKQAGFVVYLKITAEEAASRIPDPGSRPLFKDKQVVAQLLAKRAPFYAQTAHFCVDTIDRNATEIAKIVREELMARDILSIA